MHDIKGTSLSNPTSSLNQNSWIPCTKSIENTQPKQKFEEGTYWRLPVGWEAKSSSSSSNSTSAATGARRAALPAAMADGDLVADGMVGIDGAAPGQGGTAASLLR